MLYRTVLYFIVFSSDDNTLQSLAHMLVDENGSVDGLDLLTAISILEAASGNGNGNGNVSGYGGRGGSGERVVGTGTSGAGAAVSGGGGSGSGREHPGLGPAALYRRTRVPARSDLMDAAAAAAASEPAVIRTVPSVLSLRDIDGSAESVASSSDEHDAHGLNDNASSVGATVAESVGSHNADDDNASTTSNSRITVTATSRPSAGPRSGSPMQPPAMTSSEASYIVLEAVPSSEPIAAVAVEAVPFDEPNEVRKR